MAELLDKWLDRTLTVDDIKEWLREQGQIRFLMEKGALTEDDLEHIAECMHEIYRWYHDEVPSLGHFLTAVVTDRFMDACAYADRANSLALPLYAIFLYNHAPADYATKAKKLVSA